MRGFLLLILSACVTTQIGAVDAEARRADEEVAVYAAILDSLFVPRLGTHWLVSAETHSRLQPDNLSAEFWEAFSEVPRLSRSAMRDFRAANVQPRRLESSIPAGTSPGLISRASLDSLPRGYSLPLPDSPSADPSEYWRTFRSRFPIAVGVITFSRVGFRFDGRQAVVYVSYGSGSLSGGSDVVVLEKAGSGWKVVSATQFAVS